MRTNNFQCLKNSEWFQNFKQQWFNFRFVGNIFQRIFGVLKVKIIKFIDLLEHSKPVPAQVKAKFIQKIEQIVPEQSQPVQARVRATSFVPAAGCWVDADCRNGASPPSRPRRNCRPQARTLSAPSGRRFWKENIKWLMRRRNTYITRFNRKTLNEEVWRRNSFARNTLND